MGFFKALIVWLLMAVVIGAGVVMAAKGAAWLLVLSLLAFVAAVGKIGCSTH